MLLVVVFVLVVTVLTAACFFGGTNEGFFTQNQTQFEPTWKHSIAWNTCFDSDSLLDPDTRYKACKEAATESDTSTVQYHIVRGLQGLGYIAHLAPAPKVPPVAPTSSAPKIAPTWQNTYRWLYPYAYISGKNKVKLFDGTITDIYEGTEYFMKVVHSGNVMGQAEIDGSNRYFLASSPAINEYRVILARVHPLTHANHSYRIYFVAASNKEGGFPHNMLVESGLEIQYPLLHANVSSELYLFTPKNNSSYFGIYGRVGTWKALGYRTQGQVNIIEWIDKPVDELGPKHLWYFEEVKAP
jgi:hypothetical protein